MFAWPLGRGRDQQFWELIAALKFRTDERNRGRRAPRAGEFLQRFWVSVFFVTVAPTEAEAVAVAVAEAVSMAVAVAF